MLTNAENIGHLSQQNTVQLGSVLNAKPKTELKCDRRVMEVAFSTTHFFYMQLGCLTFSLRF